MDISKKRAGFSLAELMIVVAIIGILSGVAYLGLQKSRIKSDNNKVLDDLIGIANAMEQYKLDHGGSYPPVVIPDGDSVNAAQNVLCFNADATYAHDCATAAFVQGFIDNALLGTRYLPQVPTDPRTGTRYVYGRSLSGEYYQVAGLFQRNDGTFEARTQDNLSKGFPLPSIIRAYDGPDFVVQRDTFLPYSTTPHTLTATARSVQGTATVTRNGSSSQDNLEERTLLNEGDLVTMGSNGSADLYFSDGSITSLQPGAILALTDLSVETNDENGIGTKVALTLQAGKIWNKVVRLSKASEFNVETSSAIAGVRGTEFGVELASASSAVVSVKSGTVELLDPENLDPDSDPLTPPPPTDTIEAGEAVIASDAGAVADTAYAADDLEQDFYSEIPLSNIVVPRLLSAREEGSEIVLIVENIYETMGMDFAAGRAWDAGRMVATYVPAPDPLPFFVPAGFANSGRDYEIRLSAGDYTDFQVRFESDDGTRASSWSRPVSLKAGTGLNQDLLGDSAIRKPRLSFRDGHTFVIGGAGVALAGTTGGTVTPYILDLPVTLEDAEELPAGSALEYAITEEDPTDISLCNPRQATTTSFSVSSSSVQLFADLPAGSEKEVCRVTVSVVLPAPYDRTVSYTGNVVLRTTAEENPDISSLNFPPSFTGLRAQEGATDVILSWFLEMNGNGFTEMNIARLTDPANPDDDASWTPLTTTPSPITESVKSVTVPVSALADRGTENTLRVALAFTKPDGTAGEPLVIRYPFTLGEETVTSFGFTDPAGNRSTAMTATPGTEFPLNVKVFGTTLRGGLSETAPCAYTVRDITVPANPVDLGSSLVTSGRFSPAALSEARTYEITCELPDEVGDFKVVSPANIAKLTVTVPATASVPDLVLNAATCNFTDAKTNSEKGVWITDPAAQQGCWVLAKANTSCSAACSDLSIDTGTAGSFDDPGDLEVKCAEGEWNDALYNGTNYSEQCGVCIALIGGTTCNTDTTNYPSSPLYRSGNGSCDFRDRTVSKICTALPESIPTFLGGPTKRICKCE